MTDEVRENKVKLLRGTYFGTNREHIIVHITVHWNIHLENKVNKVLDYPVRYLVSL